MTPIELRRTVLLKMQVIASGEQADISDALLVQQKYEALHQLLLEENLIEWPVAGDIPSAFQSSIISMVAAELVDDFYCPPELKASLIGEGKFDLPAPLGPSVAERRIRKLSARRYDGQPARVEYF